MNRFWDWIEVLDELSVFVMDVDDTGPVELCCDVDGEEVRSRLKIWEVPNLSTAALSPAINACALRMFWLSKSGLARVLARFANV